VQNLPVFCRNIAISRVVAFVSHYIPESRFFDFTPKIEICHKTYLETSGHGEDLEGPLFRPVKNKATGELRTPLPPKSVYNEVVQHYSKALSITVDGHGLCVHSLRAIAATNVLARHADIAKVQEWLVHAHVSATRMYDKRRSRPEESPTFKVGYSPPGTTLTRRMPPRTRQVTLMKEGIHASPAGIDCGR
jgi:integrase